MTYPCDCKILIFSTETRLSWTSKTLASLGSWQVSLFVADLFYFFNDGTQPRGQLYINLPSKKKKIQMYLQILVMYLYWYPVVHIQPTALGFGACSSQLIMYTGRNATFIELQLTEVLQWHHIVGTYLCAFHVTFILKSAFLVIDTLIGLFKIVLRSNCSLLGKFEKKIGIMYT